MSDSSKDEKIKAIEKCLNNFSKAIKDINKHCDYDSHLLLKYLVKKSITMETLAQLDVITATPAESFSKIRTNVGDQVIEINKKGVNCNIDVRYTDLKVITVTISKNER